MNYYPDRIADDSDDDDVMTSCSAVETTVEGVSSSAGALHKREAANDEVAEGYYSPRSKSHPWKRNDSNINSDNSSYNDDNDELEISGHGSSGSG